MAPAADKVFTVSHFSSASCEQWGMRIKYLPAARHSQPKNIYIFAQIISSSLYMDMKRGERGRPMRAPINMGKWSVLPAGEKYLFCDIFFFFLLISFRFFFFRWNYYYSREWCQTCAWAKGDDGNNSRTKKTDEINFRKACKHREECVASTDKILRRTKKNIVRGDLASQRMSTWVRHSYPMWCGRYASTGSVSWEYLCTWTCATINVNKWNCAHSNEHAGIR